MPKVTDPGRAVSVRPGALTLPQCPSHFSHVSLSGAGRFIPLRHCLHPFISSPPTKTKKIFSSDTTESEIEYKFLAWHLGHREAPKCLDDKMAGLKDILITMESNRGIMAT